MVIIQPDYKPNQRHRKFVDFQRCDYYFPLSHVESIFH